jgi:hypothetical protein
VKLQKIKKLFKAIEAIGKKYTPEELHVQVSPLSFTLENGKQSDPIKLIPNTGKYVVPETKEISKIIKSIDPKDLEHDCMMINKFARLPIAVVMNSEIPTMKSIFISTRHGAIAWVVRFDSDEELPEPITEEELDILKQVVIQ